MYESHEFPGPDPYWGATMHLGNENWLTSMIMGGVFIVAGLTLLRDGAEGGIAAEGSTLLGYVIPTDEESRIVLHTLAVLRGVQTCASR